MEVLGGAAGGESEGLDRLFDMHCLEVTTNATETTIDNTGPTTERTDAAGHKVTKVPGNGTETTTDKTTSSTTVSPDKKPSSVPFTASPLAYCLALGAALLLPLSCLALWLHRPPGRVILLTVDRADRWTDNRRPWTAGGGGWTVHTLGSKEAKGGLAYLE
jgi:hypothetical protein